MQPFEYTPEDLEQIKEKGISKGMVEKQIKRFERGFNYLDIWAAASPNEGIKVCTPKELKHYLNIWDRYLKDPESNILKFVPASGAASRMFKALYQYFNEESEESTLEELPDEVRETMEHLNSFAFNDALNQVCLVATWKTMGKLFEQGRYKDLINNLLERKGLNYGHLPKALIPFHNYENGARTAAEEHLAEGAMYAKNVSGRVRLHFTLSPEHIDPFKSLMLKKVPILEDHFGVTYDISHSVQKPETDTIAVDMDNNPIRDDEGHLIFRPGGHGALIENLNDIDAEIIFIKNIDNVVPDANKCDTLVYKKVLAGYLIEIRDKIYGYMRQLIDEKSKSSILLEEIRDYVKETFAIEIPAFDKMILLEQVEILHDILNRPIRVCGMVRNEGEPGGGPYIIKDAKGLTSLQILESTQINPDDHEAVEIFNESSYFNPVDLVCCIKNYQGQRFNLTRFVDEETGFISHKSKDGRELKALELPGLWNGAMSGWLTAFVEVPSTTFNPVKTVNDLLRPAHQSYLK